MGTRAWAKAWNWLTSLFKTRKEHKLDNLDGVEFVHYRTFERPSILQPELHQIWYEEAKKPLKERIIKVESLFPHLPLNPNIDNVECIHDPRKPGSKGEIEHQARVAEARRIRAVEKDYDSKTTWIGAHGSLKDWQE